VYVRHYAPPQGRPAAINLSQAETEGILFDSCLSAGVEFQWNRVVTSVQTSPESVVVQTSDGSYASCGYVIGADGSRSAVRSSLGIQLKGPRWTNTFVVVDVAEDAANPLPVERVFHYEHPMVGYRNVLMVPFAGHWRIDLQCKPSDDPEEFSGPDGVRRWLSAVMPPKYADRVTWVTSYQFRQAVAGSFIDSHGRALLAGEAAHVFAPFGARGLNSGIADAYVATAAIASAAGDPHAVGVSRAIKAFNRTRRRAAIRNAAASTSALQHLTAGSLAGRGMRWTAGHLAPFITATGKWMDTAPFGPPLGDRDEDGMRY
jgi:3-(3-hydroxy-phenyl)propionate hydroxylase